MLDGVYYARRALARILSHGGAMPPKIIFLPDPNSPSPLVVSNLTALRQRKPTKQEEPVPEEGFIRLD
jgi:hypothetical protein